ncbi:metalloendopeptidase OMA1, mitochondrial-like [Odontomachus brunneus]|uniref:metalloendopeptidase OMA1, mitochondrial-like n=1 Tax=Odontomachus brunneus TaxID=486640 RepID=UPI0013F1BC67|nr:metalloendopeptidase OMA1, mitochondrial-like [Odontomachus brunneus]XP_032681591.1 metalloendopeptidase OMA1, mitochondrial-like [Odontomachus brunneus]
MLSVLRNSYQRNARLSISYFVLRSVGSHHFHTWLRKRFLVQERLDSGQLQYFKLQKCDFRTTQHLCIPPIMTLLLRPVLHIGAALMGRTIKKWWARKSKEEKEEYKQWYRERRNMFLGCFGFYGLMLFTYYITHFKTDPLTQRSRFIIFNKEQERDLGKRLHELQLEIYKKNIVPPDHPAYKRILRAFRRLIVANKDLKSMRETKWNLTVIDIPLMNSFTLPDGSIFVSLDLLRYIENDDQLEFLLAHEMAHSLLSHSLEMMSDQFLLDLLIAVPILLVWFTFPDMAAAIVHTIGDRITKIVYELPYNRVLENEADEVAIKLSAKACIDLREAVVFWATLRTLTEMEVLPSEIPWVSSHPSHGDRENNINKAMIKALEMRRDSGCPELPAVDPRTKFYERSAREQMIHFRRRGIIV